jgi:conjugal transfer mating pair stabilization protein TraN
VNKVMAALLYFVMGSLCAQNQRDALKTRDEALQALKGFNPSQTIKDFSSNPKETSLNPKEGSNELGGQGLDALNSNQSAKEIYHQAGSRVRIRPNPKSPEMRYNEMLLENPDEVLNGVCYKEKAHCIPKFNIKSCEENLRYVSTSCQESLKVIIRTHAQNFERMLAPSPFTSKITFDLTSCDKADWHCQKNNTAKLVKPCEKIVVSIRHNKVPLKILKEPSCDDPTVGVEIRGFGLIVADIYLTEYVSEEQWEQGSCNESGINNGLCFLDRREACLEPNQDKVIGGLRIKRPCWARSYAYQCGKVASSSCIAFINQGCSQTESRCLQYKNKRCMRFSQTFQCSEAQCLPEKTVCPGKITCADGKCDPSKADVSDDTGEGLSRLGALSGVAGEVVKHQVNSGTPAIFSGSTKECKKHPINFRDCCTDSGWGSWIKHCPEDLQMLQRAKHENRVVYLGSYKKHKLGAHHYSYCIFPTQLAAIIQIQGRSQQLGISYGTAKEPDCRGLTPEELERIDFSRLDLSPLEQEFIARMALPSTSQIEKDSQVHVERLKEEGRAHD